MATMLENHRVKLTPLQAFHVDTLWPIAKQMDLFKYGPNDISTREKLQTYVEKALEEQASEQSIPFIVRDRHTNSVVGCTRFGNIDIKNKTLHIGWTWIAHQARGTGLNHHMKFLMLTHAFETLGFEKVEFRIDERNLVSRKAVEKLGARLEGILRNDKIVKNGFRRSSCCYGILSEEWPRLKETCFKDIAI